MMNAMKKWIGVAVGFGSFLFALAAFADDVTLQNPLNTTDINVVLDRVNLFLIAIAAPICGILVVWGGFQMITAAGDPEKFSKGKKTLLYAAVGFVVVIFASSIAPLIKNIFGGS